MKGIIALIFGGIAGMMYILCINAGRISRMEEQWEEEQKNKETVETNLFDLEETHPNATVQIWRNSVTGETSVGWWDNEEEDD